MIRVKPPTHKIDAGGVVISQFDKWDMPRIELELKALEDAALATLQDRAEESFMQSNSKATAEEIEAVRASCKLSKEEVRQAHARHPVNRYLSGATRFQPDCADWDPAGKPTTARAYLTGPVTEFLIRRLSFTDYHRAAEVVSTIDRLTAFVRKGLRAIRPPDGDFKWEAAKDLDNAPDDVLQAIHEANPPLIQEIGAAVINYCRPLSDDEGKL
jgi:hypothetical protein